MLTSVELGVNVSFLNSTLGTCKIITELHFPPQSFTFYRLAFTVLHGWQVTGILRGLLEELSHPTEHVNIIVWMLAGFPLSRQYSVL